MKNERIREKYEAQMEGMSHEQRLSFLKYEIFILEDGEGNCFEEETLREMYEDENCIDKKFILCVSSVFDKAKFNYDMFYGKELKHSKCEKVVQVMWAMTKEEAIKELNKLRTIDGFHWGYDPRYKVSHFCYLYGYDKDGNRVICENVI